MKNAIISIVIFVLFVANSHGQTSLTVQEGDIIKLRAMEIMTLKGGGVIPDNNVIRYHIHLKYEDGTEKILIHDNPMQFEDGANVIIKENATDKIGEHTIEAWAVRVKPVGSSGENNIAAIRKILILIVEARVDNRPPSIWVITFDEEEGN